MMGVPAPISQMMKLRLHEGSPRYHSSEVAERRSESKQTLKKGQKAPYLGVPSLPRASVSLGERGGLHEVTSKLISRYDLCRSQVVTVSALGQAAVIQAELAFGACPCSSVSRPTLHLVFSLLGCPKVKASLPPLTPTSSGPGLR